MDIEFGKIIFRTILTYFFIVLLFRLMGKREIGELSILDIVIFIMLAEMAVIAIEDPKQNIFRMLVPMTVLLIIQKLIAIISLKNQRFRQWFEGKPSVIISRGKIDEHEMRKQRYNFDDLLQQLREQGMKSVQDVEFAIIEPSGKLSVFEKSGSKASNTPEGFVVPLVIDGKIQHDSLNKINQTEEWLRTELTNRGHKSIESISFCSLDKNSQWFIDIKDEK